MAHEQITIGGTSTFDDLGLIITGTPDMEPPVLNSYLVDVPGGEQVDLTAFSGDATYSKREQTFEFLMAAQDVAGIEKEKTRLLSLFHGRREDFTLSWDEGWTYTGLWDVAECENEHGYGTVKLHVTASPWKSAGEQAWLVNAAGGVEVSLPCGRRRECPTFEVAHETLVSLGTDSWTLEPGTSRISTLWLSQDDSTVLVNSYPEYCIAKWSDDPDALWNADADGRWSDECAGGQPLQEYPAWSEDPEAIWSAEAGMRWIEEMHPATLGDEYGVYIAVEVETL